MRGQNVSYTVRVPFLDAAKGARRRVQLYDGKALDVTIPAGTTDGQTLRLKGQGMPGMGGGPAGDALIEVRVDGHPHFERDGADILVEVPVTLDEAVLGAKFTVPTIDGKVALTVPPGSNTGARLRLKGKGLPQATGGGRGDQYVRLKVVLPDKPDKQLKDFIRDWAREHAYDVRRKAGLE